MIDGTGEGHKIVIGKTISKYRPRLVWTKTVKYGKFYGPSEQPTGGSSSKLDSILTLVLYWRKTSEFASSTSSRRPRKSWSWASDAVWMWFKRWIIRSWYRVYARAPMFWTSLNTNNCILRSKASFALVNSFSNSAIFSLYSLPNKSPDWMSTWWNKTYFGPSGAPARLVRVCMRM